MQALRQVFLDLDQRALDCTLQALDARRAMAFDDDTLQAEKARAIVPRWGQIGLQTLEQRQGHGADSSGEYTTLEQRLDARTDHGRQAFAGLEQDIADETVAHHHVSLTPVQAVTFDETYVVKAAGILQQRGSQLDLLVALDVFGANIEQRHARAMNAQRLGRDRAHHRELEEVLGAAIDVSAQVEQLTEA